MYIYIFVYVTCIRAHNQQENTHFQLSDMAFAYNTEKLARIAGPLHGHVLPVGSWSSLQSNILFPTGSLVDLPMGKCQKEPSSANPRFWDLSLYWWWFQYHIIIPIKSLQSQHSYPMKSVINHEYPIAERFRELRWFNRKPAAINTYPSVIKHGLVENPQKRTRSDDFPSYVWWHRRVTISYHILLATSSHSDPHYIISNQNN